MSNDDAGTRARPLGWRGRRRARWRGGPAVRGRRRFGPLPVERRTFVIGAGRTIVEVIKSELRMQLHADQALAALRAHSHG
ncbi:MAG TPA: hypothetical protein VG756_17875 [Pseudonocardiaceae bacterium]|jgi:hypothetical protein|nr:hypothetical protein [Pseudonocardiaceae bacterium]